MSTSKKSTKAPDRKSTELLKFDVDKVSAYCRDNAISKAVLSRKLGRYDSFVYEIMKSGKAMKSNIYALAAVMGMQGEDLVLPDVPKEVPVETAKPVESVPTMNAQEFHNDLLAMYNIQKATNINLANIMAQLANINATLRTMSELYKTAWIDVREVKNEEDK